MKSIIHSNASFFYFKSILHSFHSSQSNDHETINNHTVNLRKYTIPITLSRGITPFWRLSSPFRSFEFFF